MTDVLTAVSTLIIVLNPMLALPYFSGLTATATPQQKHMIANRASVITLALLLAFAFVGDGILGALGFKLHYIMIAGGLMLLIFALKDILGGFSTSGPVSETAAHETGLTNADAERVAIVPLAVPILAGPGAIATVMILNDLQYGSLATGIAVLIDTAICWTIFRLSTPILRRIRPSYLIVLGKILDILIAAIAVAFLIRGFTGALGVSFTS